MLNDYLQKMVAKAQNATDSAEAQEIKDKLIKYGKFGTIVGFGCGFVCFIGFGIFGFKNVSSMGGYIAPMLVCFFLFMPFMVLGMLGTVALKAGLGIIIAQKATDFLDQNSYCPKCGNVVTDGEMYCDKCGSPLLKAKVCKNCNYENNMEAEFCIKCGTKLD